ncbi:MAG: hypothetical protein ACI875_001629, partial [Planctomycetota bacterium]
MSNVQDLAPIDTEITLSGLTTDPYS